MNKILNFKGKYEGLSEREVSEKLMTYGLNCEVEDDSPKGLSLNKKKPTVYSAFKSLRLYLMIITAFLYFFSEQPNSILKGVLILLLAVLFCVIEFLLEKRHSEMLSKLSDESGVYFRTVRENKISIVKREYIVQDDYIILQGGENVPADAHILEASNVTVDESIFTGDETPVIKHPGSDEKNDLKKTCVYRGTRIVSGIMIARVFATGQDVKIRPEVKTAREAYQTGIESTISTVTTALQYFALISLIIAAALRLVTSGAVTAGDDVNNALLSYLSMITLPAFSLALCVIPPSLSLIIRLYYARGAIEISKHGAVKDLRSVEAFNSVTTVCLDKSMVVVADNTPVVEISALDKEMLSRIAALSCRIDDGPLENPYEKAISIDAAFRHIDINELCENTLVRSYIPQNDSDYNKINGNLWDVDGIKILCVKGSPEVVLSYCKISPNKFNEIKRIKSEYTKKGYHVIAVASAIINEGELYEDDEIIRYNANGEYDEYGEYNEYGEYIGQANITGDTDDTDEYGDDEYDDDIDDENLPETLFEVEYEYLGLIAFEVSVREEMPSAIEGLYRAGIKVVMSTDEKSGGVSRADDKSMAAIAEKVGIHKNNIVNGEKVDIIESLKAAGEVVAVFGVDSLDAKAVEAADVGIALSKHTVEKKWDNGANTLSHLTTGSTCEACDLVIDEPTNEVGITKTTKAFLEARQIHRNIKRSVCATTSVFMGMLLFSIVGIIMGGDLVLDGVFVSVLSIVALPLVAFSFLDNKAELFDKGKRLTPSSYIASGEVNKAFVQKTIIRGIMLFASLFITFAIFKFTMFTQVEKYTIDAFRSIFLATFAGGSISIIWSEMSSFKPLISSLIEGVPKSLKKSRGGSKPERISPAFVYTLGFLFVPIMIYVPFVNSAFGLKAISPVAFVLSAIIGILCQAWFDIIKNRFDSLE